MAKLSALYHCLSISFMPPKEAPKGYVRNCLQSEPGSDSVTDLYELTIPSVSSKR